MKHTKKVTLKNKPLSRNMQFKILCLFPAYFMLIGLFSQPLSEIFEGFYTIITEPDFLITDYIKLGGIGAALINASILTFISIGIVYVLKMEITGATITSIFLMMGFSLFGKNIVNIWSILLGVFVYAKYHREHLSKYIYVGFYGTSLSPIITQVIQSSGFPFILNLGVSILVGIAIGFVLPPLATHVFSIHKGYCLYNVGFAAGIIATVIVSIFKSFGFTIEARYIWSSGNNVLFMEILISFFIILIIIGMITEHDFMAKYKDILKHPGICGTDYIVAEGLGATLFNMGVNGIICTLYVIAVGSELNGPTMGGIFTVVGFSATGKHLRNIIPVMLGVYLASLIKVWKITDPSAILAALLSTTHAPIAGRFGFIAGILTGFIHSSVALSIGIVYNGMNLYNNGFAGGIVAAFLVPVILSIEDRQARAKGIT